MHGDGQVAGSMGYGGSIFFFKEVNGYLIFGVGWVVRRIDDGGWVDAWGWTGCWVNGLWWFDLKKKKKKKVNGYLIFGIGWVVRQMDDRGWVGG